MARRTGPVAWLLIWPIRFYQVAISRYTPPTCRYYPCCSSYAIGSLRRHGAIKGLVLTAWRLLRCNPWTDGGVDKVPEKGRWRWEEPAAEGDVINAAFTGEVKQAEAGVGAAWMAGRTAA